MPEQEMQSLLDHDRNADELEAHSVKYNVARIVRLSSGAFALFSHYREGAIDLIKVGTIEEIANYIPSANECTYTVSGKGVGKTKQTKLTSVDLADLGL